MFGNDQRGVAAIAVIAILAISTGVGVATPVVVDAVDVDPDSPFYGLERLGERMRMVSTEAQMEERWGEYARLVGRAKGVEYKHILEEFVDKMQEVAPGDTVAKQEIVQWMQEQMPGIGLVKLRLMRELCEGFQVEVPEVYEELENEIEVLDGLEQELPVATSDVLENIQARLQLTFQRLWRIAERYQHRISERIGDYFDIENVLVDVDVTVNVEVNITIVAPTPFTTTEFENELSEFNEKLAEVQAMLEGTPENTAGRHAAERLVEIAIDLKEKAVDAHEAGKIRKALALIHAAGVHLQNAKNILDHASEWEPEFRYEWANWKERWENMKAEWMAGGTWQSILENYQQYAENIRQRWEERMQEMGVGGGYSPVPS